MSLTRAPQGALLVFGRGMLSDLGEAREGRLLATTFAGRTLVLLGAKLPVVLDGWPRSAIGLQRP